ncbi:MAG: LPS export ABC transporter permease LptG [Bdellovibrionota bacterium]
MKILNRYLAIAFTKNLAIAIISLMALFLFQAIIGDLFDHSYTGQQVLVYHLLNAPLICVQMTAPAVLLATVFTLSSLARTNELIACFSAGIGLKRLLAVFLTGVFMVSCVVLVMEDRILPLTFKKRTIYYWHEMQKRPDFYLDIKQDKVWYRSKNMIYNLKYFDNESKAILGMSVYTFDDEFNLVQAVDAERANYTPNGWKLQNGTVTVFSRDDPFPMTKKFSEKDLLITETPRDFQEIEKEVDGLRLKELYRYIQRVKEAGADTKIYEVKFHSKISLSFIPVVMCVLGVPFSVTSRRQGGIARDLGLCLAATFFYWLFYSVGLSLGSNGVLPPLIAAWLPSVIFVALAATLIIRRG